MVKCYKIWQRVWYLWHFRLKQALVLTPSGSRRPPAACPDALHLRVDLHLDALVGLHEGHDDHEAGLGRRDPLPRGTTASQAHMTCSLFSGPEMGKLKLVS